VLDPSKLSKQMLWDLFCHWSVRARAKLPTLIFIDARRADKGFRALRPDLEMSPAVGKRKAYDYIDPSSDGQASGDELGGGDTGMGKDVADKGEGSPESSVEQPPSKRRRLFKRPAVPEEQSPSEQSPASNNRDRPKYLYSLSRNNSYKTLLDHVLALPISVQSFYFLHLYIFV
jgi:hypothetical protein